MASTLLKPTFTTDFKIKRVENRNVRKGFIWTVRGEAVTDSQEVPKIKLTFKTDDSDREIVVGSGEKQLRKLMNEEKVKLYDLYGSVMNCGGGGSCGTCLVDILEGSELLSERTDAEYRFLKKKPDSWRLACQTIIGDKTNSGEVVIQTLPQKAKK